MAEDDKQPVPYDRFKQVVDAKNALDAQLKAAQTAQTALTTEREALSAKLKQEQDASSAQADAATAKLAEISGKLAATEREALRARVAVAAGLPLDLADRLQGKTEEELKADAAKMAPFLKPTTPGVPPPPPSGGATPPKALKDMSPDEVRKNQVDILAGKIR